ncbi:hypothetical protein D3C71_1960910 [compost metagenome]
MRPERSSMATRPKLKNRLTASTIFRLSKVAKLLAKGSASAWRWYQARPKPAP